MHCWRVAGIGGGCRSASAVLRSGHTGAQHQSVCLVHYVPVLPTFTSPPYGDV